MTVPEYFSVHSKPKALKGNKKSVSNNCKRYTFSKGALHGFSLAISRLTVLLLVSKVTKCGCIVHVLLLYTTCDLPINGQVLFNLVNNVKLKTHVINSNL